MAEMYPSAYDPDTPTDDEAFIAYTDRLQLAEHPYVKQVYLPRG